MTREVQPHRSSGNVFADIGAANPEQALAKAQLARQINRIIVDRKLSQAQAAAILGVDQPRISALSKGRLSVFSLEKMMQFAARLGNEVRISIRPSRNSGIRVADLGTPGPHRGPIGNTGRRPTNATR
jgi:predicted XRE-type DNA-binding protein